ncbi:hypothetical protein SNE35_00610 [Paucibacter sp. R3-3]|uniref:MotA/TolQ/ExbB proton channel domain-containing protein n=1 Tax=Roseateles agri TaxID=3098619 RepID=A0ABU5DB04_9BURK|nr:hypothetical protein [Paucibacter sp. R3-3]MDY0742980.1 hypothetical protein [Paucibacter sp. R3-3]
MFQMPSLALRVAYCVVVLGAVLPVGVAASSWVAMARGPGLLSVIPFVGPLLLLVIGGYRVYLVARFPTTLGSLAASGVASLMRKLGMFALYVGALGTALSWASRPLMRALMTSHTESGAEYFAAGMYLALLAGLGLLGVLLFEFSCLLCFERLSLERFGPK